MFLEDIWEKENPGQWEELRVRWESTQRRCTQWYEQVPRVLWVMILWVGLSRPGMFHISSPLSACRVLLSSPT